MTNSKLSNFLSNYSKKFASKKDFAATLGIGNSHLSHIIAGQRVGLSLETISKMLAGLSHDVAAQTHILCSYLLDQVPDEFEKLIQITPTASTRDKSLRESPSTYGSDAASRISEILRQPYAPTNLGDTLEKLAIVAVDSPQLRKVLEDLTKLDIGPKHG